MPDAAKPATDEQMEALRAAFAGTSVAFGTLIRVDGTPVTVASILARYDADAAEIKALREVLAPFAAVAEHDIGTDEADADLFRPLASHNRAPKLTVGDLRRARALLEPSR